MPRPTQFAKTAIQTAIPNAPPSRHTSAVQNIAASRRVAAIPSFDELPDGAYVRLSQLVRDPKKPDAPTPLPFSAATAWRLIKAGSFVAPVKLGPRVTCFNVGLVRGWLAARSGE